MFTRQVLPEPVQPAHGPAARGGGALEQVLCDLASPGDRIEHGSLQIEILDADRRRVQRLRLKSLVPKRMTS